jgi:hypothetical protein
LINECALQGPPAPGVSPHHITFHDFCELGRKDADQSMCLLFAKQLRMIRGMSAEKAMVVANKYPTPAALMQAYSQNSNMYVHQNASVLLNVCSLMHSLCYENL